MTFGRLGDYYVTYRGETRDIGLVCIVNNYYLIKFRSVKVEVLYNELRKSKKSLGDLTKIVGGTCAVSTCPCEIFGGI